MGRKVLLTVVCWLAIAAQAKEHAVNNSIVKDNESAASAPHFHHDTYRIYATGAPYDGYALHLSEPVKSGSDFLPIKEKSLAIHKQNGFLTDSYGNKFVESPRRVAYKTTFPQQSVRLQELPVHLAQALVGAPGFHFSSNPAQLSFGAPIHVNSHRYTLAHPQVYAAHARSQALTQPRYSAPPNHSSHQQQPSTTNSYYANKQGRIQNTQPHPFQRYEEKPFHAFAHADNNPKAHDKANLQRTSQSAQREITVTENGKTTTIILDTKPVLPLLDLNLLHPLTFEKPVVSQIQHFLPKITYKLPQTESHQHEDEVIVQKTKQYNTGVGYGQPKEEESDNSSSEGEEEDDDKDDDGPPPPPPPPPKQEARAPQHPQPQQGHHDKPSITVHGNRGDPHYSYEINSPTYKETFNEKVLNYDNKGQGKPVHYSYDMKFEKKPVSYSYTSSSKNPVVNKQVQYEVHGQGPQKIVYTPQQGPSKPTAQPTSHPSRQDPPPPPQHQSEDTGESESDESGEESTSYHSGEEAPDDSHQLPPEHRHEQYHNNLQHSKIVHNGPYGFTHGPPPSPSSSPHFSQPIRVASTPTFQPTKSHNIQSITPQSYEEDIKIQPLQLNNKFTAGHHQQKPHPTVPAVYHNRNANQHDSHPQNGYHQNSNHHNIPHNGNHQSGNNHYESHGNQHHHHHNINKHPGGYHNGNNHQNHNEHPHPHVHYHQNDGPVHHPSTTFQPSQQQRQPPRPSPRPPPPQQQHPRPDPMPTVVEKFRKVIIQEETPEEMHSLQEQMRAAMVNHENMKEEDFEKSYKDAALGFPAYDRPDDASVEKDIYNSEGYGNPRYLNDDDAEDFEKTPFAQYQEDGDQFPKSARLTYRDGRDDLKEDYFLDYSVSKPESLTDMFKSKANYYKMFKKQKPKIYYGIKPKKSEKYSSAPTSFIEKGGPKFEYDYSKEAPKDAISGVESRRKGKTLFVEPQFQYGFEPSSLPYLLDSELSAMATNESPKSTKPATRKKIYKENWYIKTSKSGSDPAS